MCVQYIFFPYFQKNPREFLVTFTIWEMGLYKKECKLVLRCPFYTLAEQSQRARGRLKKEKKQHIFLHLKILLRLASILFCLEMPVRWQFFVFCLFFNSVTRLFCVQLTISNKLGSFCLRHVFGI